MKEKYFFRCVLGRFAVFHSHLNKKFYIGLGPVFLKVLIELFGVQIIRIKN